MRPRRGLGLPGLCLLLFSLASTAFPGARPGTPHSPSPDSSAPPARHIPAIVMDDLDVTLHDAAGFFTAPLAFDRADADRLIAWTGSVGITMAMDEPLNNLMVTYPPPEGLTGALDWGEEWGRLRTMQIASLGIYLGGLALGEDDVRVTGRLMGEALLLAGVPAITLQYTLGRSRPNSGNGAFDYNFFEWSNEFQSLPSGHATVAFAISTVLAKRIGRWWVSVPLYASAGLTMLSLGWHNQHWPSDLLIGATLGYLAGSFVVARETERSAGAGGGPGASRLKAGIGPGGVTVSYRLF